MKLTDLTLKKLTEGTYYDDVVTGLHVRVSPKGVKAFSLLHTVNGRRKRTKIGRYPTISLSESRQKAKEVLAAVTLGSGVKTPENAILTAGEAYEAYRRLHISTLKPSTQKNNTYILEKHFKPLFTNKINTITKGDITAIVDKLLSTPTTANHAVARIREFMNWCVERGYIDVSPVAGLKKPFKERTRDRVLTYDELGKIKRASESIGYPFGHICLLLIYTLCRRDEIAKLRWPWIEHNRVQIPETKNGSTHVLPLSTGAMQTLATIPKHSTTLLFPARGNTATHVSGFSYAHRKIRRTSGVDGWTFHDIRRTGATHIAEAGVPESIVSRILNHTPQSVTARYNRYEYFDEMKDALETYSSSVLAL